MNRRQIEARWGMPFWDLVQAFADQFLTRRQVGVALGMHPEGFAQLLRANPEHDPFDGYNVPARYVKETGEPFDAAVMRLAREGYSLRRAAHELGFKCHSGLQYCLRVRKLTVRFTPPERKAARRSGCTA